MWVVSVVPWPMPDAGLDTNRVSLADPFDRSALGLSPAAASRYEEVLPCRVRMPVRARIRLEGNDPEDNALRTFGGGYRLDCNDAREVLGGAGAALAIARTRHDGWPMGSPSDPVWSRLKGNGGKCGVKLPSSR